MRLSELVKNTDVISMNADGDIEITGIFNDSRSVISGSVFVAVPGFSEDGAKYIPSALENGAAVIACESGSAIGSGIPHIVVEDTRRALSSMSAEFYGRPAEKLKVVGVTGTNGKTTTAYIIKHILDSRFGLKTGLIGTNEVIIGEDRQEAVRTTPESFELQQLFRRMLDASMEYAVMEVSSHALKLHRVDDISFEVGVFTNLTQDHLDFHVTMEDYLESKAKLFSLCRHGVVNLDDHASGYIEDSAGCQLSTYSIRNGRAGIQAKNVKLLPAKVEFETLSGDSILRTELNIPGEFSVYNALAATGACLALGLPLEDIIVAMKTYGGVKGRAEVVDTATGYTVMIDYAHTPDALENILRTIRGFAKGRIISVFGCGGDRDRDKRPKMGYISEQYADISIVTSDNPRTEQPEAIIEDIVAGMKSRRARVVITDRVEAIHHALSIAQAGDVVLLAGKGHETYQEVNGVKHHMDEREIVKEYLAEK